jgi:uncharacterized protein
MSVYTDLNLSLTRHPITNDITPLSDADAVKRSVQTLVRTAFYDRPFEPSLGTRISALLFEPMDAVIERLIVDEIKNVIDTYEPRAKVIEITATGTPEQNSLAIGITFEVKNLPTPVTLNLTLNRLR